jgi:predicted HTH domain antitoxin
MTIEIPDAVVGRAQLSRQDILLSIAILLFAEEKVTLGQAAQIAGMPQFLFQKELANRKIPIHYGAEEYQRDLETISKMEIS